MSSPVSLKKADSQMGFSGQSEGERVFWSVRRHPLVVSSRLLMVVLAAWLPWLVFIIGPGFSLSFTILFCLTAILGSAFLFVVWSDWYNTLYLVTNQRVITTHQHYLWRRQVREVPLAKILEVRHDQSGLIKIALHVGDVIIRTAAAELVMHDISNPYNMEQQIGSLIHRSHKPRQSAPVEY